MCSNLSLQRTTLVWRYMKLANYNFCNERDRRTCQAANNNYNKWKTPSRSQSDNSKQSVSDTKERHTKHPASQPASQCCINFNQNLSVEVFCCLINDTHSSWPRRRRRKTASSRKLLFSVFVVPTFSLKKTIHHKMRRGIQQIKG